MYILVDMFALEAVEYQYLNNNILMLELFSWKLRRSNEHGKD